jgi:trans-2,3-dihydro-3-hydroxyanthranilate isomerase
MGRRYYTLDVFTNAALAGNPLAVVMDSDGLDSARMQAIAREFNLAETVFVGEPKNPINIAALRIFTPARELPFAGHPTIGAAILLAHLREPELLKREDLRVVIEEQVGEIVCVARHRKGKAMAAYFTLPRLPASVGKTPSTKALAEALGVKASEIGFGAHRPSAFSAGAPFVLAPLRDLAAMARATPHLKLWGELGAPAVFLYTNEVARPGSSFHARMFASGWGIVEDPATGSAAAALAGAIMRFESPAESEAMYVIEQGLEMGRPSFISLGLAIEDDALISATVGGEAVLISQGTIDL